MPNYPDLFYLMTKWPPLETNLYQLVHLPPRNNYLNFLCYNYSVCIFDTNETNLSSYSTLNLVVLIKKYIWLRCLLLVKGLAICFSLGWSDSILQFRQNIIKVVSKSWLLTCSNNITLMLPDLNTLDLLWRES